MQKAWKKNEETHSVDLEIPNLSNGVLNGEDWDNVREKIINSKKRRKKCHKTADDTRQQVSSIINEPKSARTVKLPWKLRELKCIYRNTATAMMTVTTDYSQKKQMDIGFHIGNNHC